MLELIEELKREIVVIFFAMTPVVEIRGAIPLGISLGLSPLHSTIISIIGNITIVPFLLKLLQPIMEYFEKTVLFSKTVGWIKKRSMSKADIIKRYSLLGLFIFVAIPMPGTGAWTGCIIASLLKLNFRKALISISMGIISAGIIVATVSYKIFSIF